MTRRSDEKLKNQRGLIGLKWLLLIFAVAALWMYYKGYIKWTGPQWRLPRVTIKN